MGTSMGTSGIDWSTLASNSQSSSSAGFSVSTIVNEVIQSQRSTGETEWQTEETNFTNQSSALTQLGTQLQSLLTSVHALGDATGSLNARTTSVSDSDVLSASASAGAAVGNHSITVTSLASTASFYSNELASSSTTFTAGTLSIQVGSGTATSITVDSTDNTLAGLADAINNQKLGVDASVVTDAGGARLMLVSQASGAAGNITITSNTTGLTLNRGATGADAALTVDGVPVDSASNSVTVNGLTLNLLGRSSSPVTVQVAPDTSQAASAINSFVSAYNTIVSSLNSQFSYNAGAGSGGALMGDAAAEMVQSTLLGDVSTSLSSNGAISTLADLGVTMGDDGTLTVDSSKLTGALTSNFQSAATFFQTASTGFAQKFASDLTNLTDPTNGPINIDLQGVKASISSLQSQIADFEANLVTEKQSLMTYYSNINTTLQSLPTLLSSVNSQLASLKSS